MTNDYINKKDLIYYSSLSILFGFLSLPIYIYIPSYYNNNFPISLTDIAIILFFVRLIDAISDPIIGIVSDRYIFNIKKIVLYLTFLLSISFILLIYPASIINIKLSLFIFLSLTSLFSSILYINYLSISSYFTNDYHQKTIISSYREIFFVSGLILGAISPSILFIFFDEVISFTIIAIFYFFISIIITKLFNNNNLINKVPSVKNKESNLKLFITILFSKKLRRFFIIFFLNIIATSIPAILIMFFIDKIIFAKELSYIFFITYFIALLIGIFLWKKISFIFDSKIKIWKISIILSIIIFFFTLFLSKGDKLYYLIICFLSGIILAADYALIYSILTDIIQKNNLQNQSNIIYSITNFILKMSFTIISSIIIYLIGFFEYNVIYQKYVILISYSLLPIILRSIILMMKF